MDSTYKKKILILGAGTWLVPYIQKANDLGLETFVTDWSDDAEGKKFAHVFEAIDLKDKEATLMFAKKHKIDAIFTSADIGVQTAAYVAKNLGLKYHSEELAFNATNKRGMRQKAKQAGLGIPSFYCTNNIEEAKAASKEIGYPVIIKPVDNFSSRGVSVLYSEEDLEHFFHESLSASFEGNILIEEFMQGTEGSVEALVMDGIPYIMGICDKVKSALPFRYDLQLNYPGNYSEEEYKLINDFITKLVREFDIENGIIHVEIMVNSDNVKLIEFGIRGCGSKVITHLMPDLLKFDVLKFLLLSTLGIKQEIKFQEGKSGVLKFIMLDDGVITEISGIKDVLNIEGVIDFDIERKSGDSIGLVKDGRSRPGYLLAQAKDKNELNEVIKKVVNTFSVTYT